MGKMIAFKNNKGGVGKSWITLQVGHALVVLFGYKVLIITSDTQNNILLFAGIDAEPGAGLESWVTKGDGDLIRLRENLYYIPLSVGVETSKKFKANLKNTISQLKQEYDFILLDPNPTLRLDKEFTDEADYFIIPTFLDQATSQSMLNIINDTDKRKVKAVIPNRYTNTKKEKEYYNNLKDIFNSYDIYLSLPLAQSPTIGKLIDKGKTIWDVHNQDVVQFKQIIEDVLDVIV